MSRQRLTVGAHRRSNRTVFPATGALVLILSAALWTPVLLHHPATPVPDPPVYAWAALLAAFVVCEFFPLRVEVRSETLLVSLSELPLVIGVLLLPPWVVGVVYAAGGLAVFLARRDSWRNIVMNLSLMVVECGAAVATVWLVAAMGGAADPIGLGARYLPVAAGVLIGALLSALAVGIAYRLIGPAEPLSRVVLRSMLTAAVIVGLALTGVTVWSSSLGGPILCAGLLLALALLYRNYSTFLRQHTDLAALYEFGRSVTEMPPSGDDAAWLGLVEQVREQLNARLAVLQLTDHPGGARTLAVGPDGPVSVPATEPGDPLLSAAATAGSALGTADRGGDPAMAAALRARGAREALVVPLRSGTRDRGFLEVRDRRTRWGRFSDDDASLLATLGGHLGTALDNQRLVERLSHEAYHDAVTGLPNRAGLHRAAAELARTGQYGGVLLLELGVLDDVNRALGRDRGDQLLAAAGQRLSAAAGADTPAGRIEVGRFAVLLRSAAEPVATSRAQQILAAMGRPFAVDGIDVEPHVTAGVALRAQEGGAGRTSTRPKGASADTPTDTDELADHALLQCAELALLSAQARDEQLVVYQDAMGQMYQRRFQLITQFRHAVEAGRVVLHYQPKLALAERELAGVEALVRWMHPEYGFVSPAELIEAIEPTGSIDVLFSHVLHLSLAQIAQWSGRGLRIGVAVNLSVRNLLAPHFAARVADALRGHDVAADLLTLEVTESAVMAQPERSLPVLRELHALGIRLSVDDFGTGYSSLAYLRRLPIDEIKIDRSFVQGMVTDLSDMAIVRAIIDLGHSLGLRVVAEGVEEEAARDALRAMRCDTVQGYLVSRPLPATRFDAWLATRTVSTGSTSGERPTALRVRG